MGSGWKNDFDNMFLWDTVNETSTQKKRGGGSRKHSHNCGYDADSVNQMDDMELWKWEHKFIEEQLKKYTKQH